MPFEEIASRLAAAAWERARGARGAARLSAAAARGLRRGLLEALSAGLSGPLTRELAVRRSVEVSGFEALLRDRSAPPSRRLYAALVEEATGAGRAAFWLERAALARALGAGALSWAQALAELLGRLEDDGAGLETLGVRRGEAVAALDFGVSDLHDGGRRVGLLTFASGVRVVYKPRGAELLTAWEAFLAELDALGFPDAPRRRRQHAPGPHAWLEFVERAPCRDEGEADAYYRRSGALLAVMHVLQARDLHFDNVVAAGAFPAPIDLEVILQGDARRPGGAGSAAEEASALLDRSVFATGLLPIWPENQDDFGALGAGVARMMSTPVWRDVNTDEMRVEWEKKPRETENSRVELDGRPVDAYGRIAELRAGFRAAAKFLGGPGRAARGGAAHRRLAAAPVRALLRATSVYARLQGAALDLSSRADGVDRGVEIEALAAAWAVDDASREMWGLGRAEIRAMEAGDVPLVHARAEGGEAWTHDGGRGPLMTRTGLDASLAAWSALDEAGLALQDGIIRASMIGRVEADPAGAVARPRPPAGPFSAERARAAASALAGDIDDRAVRTSAGRAWIEPAYDARMTHLKLTLLGAKLYDGSLGLALFLAAAGRRESAREAAAPLLGVSESDARRWARALGIGGGVGAGGAFYALARAGAFLGDDSFTESARALARGIASEAIDEAKEFDVMFGTAGAALSYLGLHAADPRDEWLGRAVRCGERLLATRDTWEGLPRAWRAPDGGAPAGGFSHGAAGAACALWRLGERTGDARFKEAAEEAWAFDDALFCAETGQWRRHAADADGSAGRGWATWCWGAPGAALSRLEAAAAGNAAALAGAERALALVRSAAPRLTDHACCGEFGPVDVLLEAGLRLGRPALADEARARAAAVLPADGLSFRLHPGLEPGPTSPTFFGGTAGIGYALLRLAGAKPPPCVISWS